MPRTVTLRCFTLRSSEECYLQTEGDEMYDPFLAMRAKQATHMSVLLDTVVWLKCLYDEQNAMVYEKMPRCPMSSGHFTAPCIV